MTREDQKILKEMRDQLTEVAKKAAIVTKKGYAVTFSIDTESGTLKSFDVKAPIDIDSSFN